MLFWVTSIYARRNSGQEKSGGTDAIFKSDSGQYYQLVSIETQSYNLQKQSK